MDPEDDMDTTRVPMSKLRRSSFVAPYPPPQPEGDTPRAHYASAGFRHIPKPSAAAGGGPTFMQDLPNMVLLVILYMMQVRASGERRV